MIEETTTTTTTESEIERNRYRFGGKRYQLQGTSRWGPSVMIPQIPGLMTYPESEEESGI